MFGNKKIANLIAMVALVATSGRPQDIGRIDRERAQAMLQTVAADVQKYYYDPKLHGLDWDAEVKNAKEKIAQAKTGTDLLVQIGAVLESLNDSHTFFIPPSDPVGLDYGWRYEMVGAHCFVTQVRPLSDADAKGLKPGDEVLTIDGFTPTRDSLSKIQYALNVLIPQRGLSLVLRDQAGKIRRVDVMAKVPHTTILNFTDETGLRDWMARQEFDDQRRLLTPQYKEFGEKLLIVKLPTFSPETWAVREVIHTARHHNYVILDLRGNPGGAESGLTEMLGALFEKDVKIADRITREKTIPLMAKGSGNKAFHGTLIVLVDSQTASAAEMFARVIQIEKRGIVLGDRTSGNVMEAKLYVHSTGFEPTYTFGAFVTSADLIMVDGKSLERNGVTPDETILPTASDLANGRDPVMARAATIAGVTLSPEDASKLFPYEWPTN